MLTTDDYFVQDLPITLTGDTILSSDRPSHSITVLTLTQ